MISKTQRKFIYGLTIHLLLIAVVCYAAFPLHSPDRPIRVMYSAAAGNVLFDHATHTSPSGFGVSCADCHHHPADDDSALVACSYCHQTLPDDTAYPESCLDCHDEDEIEDTQVPNAADAAHGQCIGCHKEFEAGPDACSGCHVL
jgi:hypothetical protein